MKNKLINLRNFVMYYITGATAGMPDGPEAGNMQLQWMQELPQIKENMFTAVNALLLSKKTTASSSATYGRHNGNVSLYWIHYLLPARRFAD